MNKNINACNADITGLMGFRDRYVDTHYPDYTTINSISLQTGRPVGYFSQACRGGNIDCIKVYTPYASGKSKSIWVVPKRLIPFYNQNMLVSEAGVVLSLSRQRVHILTQQGALPSVKAGTTVFINVKSVIHKALERSSVSTIVNRIKSYIEEKESGKKATTIHHFLQYNILPYLRKCDDHINKVKKSIKNQPEGCVCHRLTTLP